MIFERETTIDAISDGDTVLQAILDLDRDISGLFGAENSVLRRSTTFIPATERGEVWGVCELDSSSLIPTERLPVIDAAKLPDGTVPPSGTIILWPSKTAPDGWMECDGSKLNLDEYSDLYDAIGFAFGGSKDEDAFAVPCLQGYFVRCMDHGASVDLDAYYRTDRGDGESGDVVGSIQGDANLAHTHNFIADEGEANYGAAEFYKTGTSSAEKAAIGSIGGKQGHPLNISLMWIIKI